MGFAEYDRYDALGLAELVRRREVTPLELLEEAIARADRLNPRINAIIHRMDDAARVAARAGLGEGPFAGVPYLVKDLGPLLSGAPMCMGSRAYQGFTPDHDSELIRRSKSAGLNIFGKTNTPEFGIMPYTEPVLFGPCRNPWDLTRTPGGSSGGAAAAIAAGIVPMAHGNDGGGSIRIPASCCGLFGLKPSRGRQPIGPDGLELVGALAVDHAISRSVRDSAALLDATHGRDVGMLFAAPEPAGSFRDAAARDPGRLRIALVRDPMLGKTVAPDCRAALEHSARLLGDLGHIVDEAGLAGIDYEAVKRATLTLFFAATTFLVREAARLTGRAAHRRNVEAATWFAATLYRMLSASDVSEAVELQNRLARSIAEFMSSYDLILTPTLAAPPIRIGEQQPTTLETLLLQVVSALRITPLMQATLGQFSGRAFDWVAFTPLFNLTGQPAASLPLYWTAEGLPVGTQLVARYGDEVTLFQIAGQLERAQPWFDRRPSQNTGG